MKDRPIILNSLEVSAVSQGAKTQLRRLVQPSPGRQKTWLTASMIDKVPSGKMIRGGWQMYHPLAGKYYEGITIAPDSPLGWVKCPYGQPGDTLWVREKWKSLGYGRKFGIEIHYEANGYDPSNDYNSRESHRIVLEEAPDRNDKYRPLNFGPWRSAVSMPRWASRLSLKIKDIKVERLQNLSEEDAQAEGVRPFFEEYSCFSDEQPITCGEGRPSFAAGTLPYKASFAVRWDEINEDKALWSANPWVWVIEFERVS